MSEDIKPEQAGDAAKRLVGEFRKRPKQAVDIKSPNDTVLISRYVVRRTDVMGGEEIARLEMGGHGPEDHNGEPARVALVNVWDKSNADYQAQVALAKQQGIETSDLLLLSFRHGFTGVAFLPPHQTHTLGREGDIQWLPFGQFFSSKNWTPFDENDSVSRRQVILRPTENGVVILGISENSNTRVESAGIQEATTPISSLD